MNNPDVIIRDLRKEIDLSGVIISCSNTIIKNNKDTSISIFIGHGAGDKNMVVQHIAWKHMIIILFLVINIYIK